MRRYGYRDDIPTRDEVRAVRCPACGVAAGALCVDDGKIRYREANHAARLSAYKHMARAKAGRPAPG